MTNETDNTDPRNNVEAQVGAMSASGAVKEILSDDFDALEAIGGWRGLIESVAPTVLFLAVYVLRDDLNLALIISVGVAVALIALRAVQRISVTPALGGLIGIALSALIAWRSGEASNFFVTGLITNAAYLLVLTISVVVKWPLLGVIIGFFRGDATKWRTDPSQKRTRARYYQVTLLWIFLFAARLVVQLPMYLANATEPLGVARLVMGVPFFGLTAWFSWLLIKDLPPVADGESDDDATSASERVG